jgi:hypothetical protein
VPSLLSTSSSARRADPRAGSQISEQATGFGEQWPDSTGGAAAVDGLGGPVDGLARCWFKLNPHRIIRKRTDIIRCSTSPRITQF